MLAIGCHAATAQVPPTVTVQQTAPQLVLFAGSQTNFQSLVNGLSQGTPVQLITTLPNGLTQVVTFTPAAPLSPSQIAQTLETARQQLIGLGIGNPTSEQIAVALMGGVVPTPLGGSQVAGVLNPQNPPSPAAQIQSNSAAGATAAVTAPGTTPTVTPPVNVQLFPGTATGAATANIPARVNTSDSPIAPGATSRSPLPAPVSNSPSPLATPTPPQSVGGAEVAAGAPAPAPTTPERSGAAPAGFAAPAAGGADRR
jgi:hypothetical protein